MLDRRKDDSFLRKIVGALLIALALETIGGLYFYGQVVERVDQLEREVVQLKILSTTIRNIDKTLTRVDTKVDYLTKKLDNAGSALEIVKSEQEKRTSIVYDAQEHIKNRNIHGK